MTIIIEATTACNPTNERWQNSTLNLVETAVAIAWLRQRRDDRRGGLHGIWHKMKLTDIDLVKVERNFDCISVCVCERLTASVRTTVMIWFGIFRLFFCSALYNLMLPKCFSFFRRCFFVVVVGWMRCLPFGTNATTTKIAWKNRKKNQCDTCVMH